MSLIIIAEKEVQRHCLEEALQSIDVDIETLDRLGATRRAEDFSFGVAVLCAKNKNMVLSLAQKIPVFAVMTIEVSEEESAILEDSFVPLVRLGHVAQTIKQTITSQAQRNAMNPVAWEGFILDPKFSILTHQQSKKTVRLTEKETAILIFLAQNQECSTPRQDLLNKVWGYVEGVETHTLETHIYRLRQKIKNTFGVYEFLITDEQGYRLQF